MIRDIFTKGRAQHLTDLLVYFWSNKKITNMTKKSDICRRTGLQKCHKIVIVITQGYTPQTLHRELVTLHRVSLYTPQRSGCTPQSYLLHSIEYFYTPQSFLHFKQLFQCYVLQLLTQVKSSPVIPRIKVLTNITYTGNRNYLQDGKSTLHS